MDPTEPRYFPDDAGEFLDRGAEDEDDTDVLDSSAERLVHVVSQLRARVGHTAVRLDEFDRTFVRAGAPGVSADATQAPLGAA